MHRKYQRISKLTHSYMFRRIRGAIFSVFSMSLLSCCTISWKLKGFNNCSHIFYGLHILLFYISLCCSFHDIGQIQQAHTELPENGASDAPKHVGVR
jgi:hypothetical protein